MKTKILINNEEVEITLTPEQVEAITAQQKPKQWEPQGGEWNILCDGSIYNMYSNNCNYFGTEYQTKEQAEKARDAMRPRNRLLAWIAENDDGWVADWKDIGQNKYYLILDNKNKKYTIGWCCIKSSAFDIYMSKQNIEKLCKLLNSSEIIL